MQVKFFLFLLQLFACTFTLLTDFLSQVGDNLLPLIAQIILDAYLSPQYLYLPRMLLIHNPQMESMMSWSKGQARGVPHMELIGKLMSGGGATLKQVSNY